MFPSVPSVTMGSLAGPQWNSCAALPSAMLQTAMLKRREVKQLASGHPAAKWRRWDSDPDSQAHDHEDVLCLEGNTVPEGGSGGLSPMDWDGA